jgi:hypothetical protein
MISAIVTMGFGSFGSIPLVTTMGFASAELPEGGGGYGSPLFLLLRKED